MLMAAEVSSHIDGPRGSVKSVRWSRVLLQTHMQRRASRFICGVHLIFAILSLLFYTLQIFHEQISSIVHLTTGLKIQIMI